MSSRHFKSDSYYVGGRYISATENVYGDITSEGSKILIDSAQFVIENNLRLLVITHYSLKISVTFSRI